MFYTENIIQINVKNNHRTHQQSKFIVKIIKHRLVSAACFAVGK